MQYLDKATLALKHVASKEASRYALNGINIEPGRAMATNGKVAAIVKAPKEGDKSNGFKSAIIGSDLLKKIEKNMPKMGEAELVETKKGLEISIPEGPDTTVIMAKALSGTFPNLESVWPKGEPKATICLDVDLLMDLAKVAEAAGDNRRLTLEIHAPDAPVKVTSPSNDRFEGIIVPCIIQ